MRYNRAPILRFLIYALGLENIGIEYKIKVWEVNCMSPTISIESVFMKVRPRRRSMKNVENPKNQKMYTSNQKRLLLYYYSLVQNIHSKIQLLKCVLQSIHQNN